jgi:hypothetical protein
MNLVEAIDIALEIIESESNKLCNDICFTDKMSNKKIDKEYHDRLAQLNDAHSRLVALKGTYSGLCNLLDIKPS